MRKTYTLIVMLAMLFVGMNSVSAQVTQGDYTFGFYSSGKAYISAYTGTDTEITIPATITYDKSGVETTVDVVGFGTNAFAGNTTIEKIYLPNNSGYTTGASAFKGCTALNTIAYSYSGAGTAITRDNYITIPTSTLNASVFEGCTSIQNVYARYSMTGGVGNNAFKGCTSLLTASISAACKSIGESAFEGCTALTTVEGCNGGTVSETSYGPATIGKNAFKDCVSLIRYGATAGRVSIYTAEVGEGAFENCQAITRFLVSASLGNGGFPVPKNCFKGCVALDSIAQSVYIGTIGESAFEGCTSLRRTSGISGVNKILYFPHSTSIGMNAFKRCTTFDRIWAVKLENIGDSAFEGCTSMTAIYKNSSETFALKTIGANAFKNCTKFNYIGNSSSSGLMFPSTMISIGASAFENCEAVANATFEDGLTSIGASAFKGCSALSRIILNTLTPPTLGEDAFTGIKANSYFYIYPNNSYTAAGKYALNDGWKVFFNGSKGSNYLIAYVNKNKQYGTVSCDVPLYFYTTTTIANLYKVIASSDNYAYMEAVSSKRLPANTGAVIDVEVDGTVKTSTAVQVLFSTVSATDWSDNLLVANVTENTSFVGQETDGTYNLLLSDGKFVKATDGTLAAGLAYLPMNFGGGEAKELSLTTDEPTGIKTIDNGEPTVDNGAWYTIDGTRLQGEPTMKGIYVRGGKKVVVK